MADNPKQAAFAELKRAILMLDLAPGSALDEKALSVQFGLSRTPLREVFQRLAGLGYLTLTTNRGATVASMDLTTMRHFFQSAPLVYSAIARLAAEQASAADIVQLQTIQGRFEQALITRDAKALAEHNHQFHECIGRVAASPYLLPSLDRLLVDHSRMSHRFYRVQSDEAEHRVAEASRQHGEMIDAFAANDPEQAVALTLAHWDLSRREMDKYVLPDPLPLDGIVDNASHGRVARVTEMPA